MSPIRPTHHCFDDALDFFEEVVGIEAFRRNHAQYTVVHAICIAPDGNPFAHAWVEHGALIWEAGIVDDARVFFARTELGHPVVRAVRYSVADAIRLNYESEHYGPWDAEIKALCAAKGEHVLHGESAPFAAVLVEREESA